MLTKEQLKNSMDAKWRLRQFYIYLWAFVGVSVFMLLILLVAFVAMEDLETGLQITGGIILIYALVFLPFLLYNYSKYRAIFANLADWQVYTVTLDRPSLSYWYRGAAYFSVDIPMKSGYCVTRDTKPLWSNGMFAQFVLGDYVNRKMLVAYNATDDNLVCLGLADQMKEFQ